ncbi:interferon-induced very large GTPase 1-like [Myripristis murdjan]|uniref:interferon-induced very large GTPase 1-like n=1 Tax=Myripristis murdjan TaxID=586833 RepID=UPI001175ECF1|nr:interferon-induced very large GTPase 1-like [Myripristis murdjan]
MEKVWAQTWDWKEQKTKRFPLGIEAQARWRQRSFPQTEKSTIDEDRTGEDTGEDKDKVGQKQNLVKTPEAITTMEQRSKEVEALFSRLHLENYKSQQKLTPAVFLKIGPSVKQQHETSEKDLADTYIQRLMTLDHRARYIAVKEDPAVSHPNQVQTPDSAGTDESVFDAFFSTEQETEQRKQSHVHPMDVQMAVFHCSDSFLKLDIISKLSQCQYALPLLVPDPFKMDIVCPMWTFRQIRKSWKQTDDSNLVTMKSVPICKAETPMVAFLRLGSVSTSKSQLMSSLINERHNTFFHRNCPGSTKSRYLIDGLAEIAWYCPSGKPNDVFTDCIAFCNLHGDALSCETQRDILIEKSSVNVILLPSLEKSGKSSTILSDLLKSPKPLICLIADNASAAVEVKEGTRKYKMGLKDKSLSEVSEELKAIIKKILSSQYNTFKLESMTEVRGIRMDEDDEACQRGKSVALQIQNLLEEKDISKIKDTFLQCQGKLWKKWCEKHKGLYRLQGQIEKEKCQTEKELKQIREKQCDVASNELMNLFLKNLRYLHSHEKKYFLKWTGILLDDLSTDDLSGILQAYDEKWTEVLNLKKKDEKGEKHNQTKKQSVEKQRAELEELSAKLQSATFGLEHMFREMGQIYEAHASVNRTTGELNWSNYPELAAELMISGHPMELMDGDAGHVPLTWITCLLDAVIKKLGDKRIFVLSVLGIQSSGKSTMLNAMFGLQFAVSAGRCTRGAFMQLVKVSAEIQKDFKFDYVLVVDTEGLRALELAENTNLHHDNELATFVIGLGNLTLINIFGENPADMQDILQIVVQAFMRMKEVNLSPSCVFVHQNVTDIAAGERNMEGKRRLQEKLDKMAQLAAKEEVCNADCFSDIITFNVQTDVQYFAQLWEGSPPMAPPNPGYSESIQELKNIILTKASKSEGLTLSQFRSRISDLWNALLNEHFVFSFKNTQEIAVYRKLEVQYGKWTWALRCALLNIEHQLHNRIEIGKLDKVAHSYLVKEMTTTQEDVQKAMKTYFDDDEDKEMLVQWRGRFESKIKEFHDEQVKEVKRKLEEVIQQRKACKELDDKKAEFENKLLQKSKELAHELKDKAKDEKELQKQFNRIWDARVRELEAAAPKIKDIYIEDDLFCILTDLGIEWSLIFECKKRGKYKNMPKIGNYFGYVTITKGNLAAKAWENLKAALRMNTLPYEENQQIRSFITEVERQSIEKIQTKPVASRGYTSTYLHEVASNVKDKVKAFESETKTYTFKNDFTVDLLLYVCHIAGNQLLKSHEEFKTNNDPLTYLESKKDHHYRIFVSYCEGNSSAAVLGELICNKLKDSTVQAVYNMTAMQLADEMMHSYPPLSGNKANLEKHILKSLAEKEDFDSYINYLRRPRSHMESFIIEEVEKYILTEHKDKALSALEKNVKRIEKLVSDAVETATENVKTQGGDIDTWLEEFSSSLEDELAFSTNYGQNFGDINDFDFFKEELDKGIKSIVEEMSSLTIVSMEQFSERPDQLLIDHKCKTCWTQCPFCGAVCTNTYEDHSPNDHMVTFHRPDGIKGWHFRGTVELSIDFCSTLVTSNQAFYPNSSSDQAVPYKVYKTAGGKYAEWSITPDNSTLAYWKWFVCRFQKDLEDYHEKKFKGKGEIPSEWKRFTKEDAIKSLESL